MNSGDSPKSSYLTAMFIHSSTSTSSFLLILLTARENIMGERGKILWDMRENVMGEETAPFSSLFYTVNPFPNKPCFLHVCSISLLKHRGKIKNCSYRAISPFPTVFSTILDNFLPFSLNMKLSTANYFSLEESTICRLGKG